MINQQMNHLNKNKAIFLDRDGVIIRDYGYVYKPQDLEFLPHAVEALLKLQSLKFLLIIVSNQSGVARGLFSIGDLHKFNTYMCDKLSEQGVILDATYYCPHHPQGNIAEFSIECECRKPQIGLLLKAQKDFNIDLKNSYIIGDKSSDIETGLRANLKGCIQIIDGSSSYSIHPHAHFYAKNLLEAYQYIIDKETQAS